MPEPGGAPRRTLLILTGVIVLLGGCVSAKYTTTSPSQPSPTWEHPVRFRIAGVSVVGDRRMGYGDAVIESATFFTAQRISEAAARRYPDLFAESSDALPVRVRLEISHSDSTAWSSLLMACSVTVFGSVLPLPSSARERIACSVEVIDPLYAGSSRGDGRQFDVRMTEWVSLLTPLGLLPVPGQAKGGRLPGRRITRRTRT